MNIKLIKIKMKNFEFKAERKEIISQKVPEKVKEIYPIFKDIDKMPKGCAVIGGAARNLAFYMVNPSIEGVIPVRDVDVAFFPEEISKIEADIYAAKFSPDDYAHNHGAQEIFNIEEYMDGRDFTMNQIIYKDGEIIMSRAAIRDIYKGVINPCEDRDEDNPWRPDENDISTRLAMKAVLQETVLSENVKNIKINDRIYCSNFGEYDYCSSYDGFQLALAIQKSFDYGKNIPQKFIQNVAKSSIFTGNKDILSNDRGEVRELYDIMTDLNENILTFPFDFRNSALKYFMDETNDAIFEDRMKKYEFFENIIDERGGYRYR